MNRHSRPPRITIVGLGNVLAHDEGIGPRTAEILSRYGLPENVRVVDIGSDGIALLDYFEDSDEIIIVDCAMMESRPGTIRVFEPSEVASQRCNAPDLSLHSRDILGLIELGRTLGPVPRIRIVGVQPEQVDSGMGLSDTLERRLPDVVQTVLAEIGQIAAR